MSAGAVIWLTSATRTRGAEKAPVSDTNSLCPTSTPRGRRRLPVAVICLATAISGALVAPAAHAVTPTDLQVQPAIALDIPLATENLGAIPPIPAPVISPAVQLQSKQHAMIVLTTRSAMTKDLSGLMPSMYRGKYFHASQERLRQCIILRESEAHYTAVSRSGTYRGAYQVSPALARGVTWMLLPEHQHVLGTAAAQSILAHLRTMPMSKWPRYWQDAAFYTIANYKGLRSGVRAWAGGRWHC